MKQLFLVYLLALFILSVNFYSVKKAYTQWSEYSGLTKRANNILITYEEIGLQTSTSNLFNPELQSIKHPSTHQNILLINRAALLANIYKLNSLVRDSVNCKIAVRLAKTLIPEIDWIINSKARDSIIRNKSGNHFNILKIINGLINKGISRTKFVINYRQQQLDKSFERLVTLTLVLFILFLSLLAYAILSSLKLYAKTKKKDGELIEKDKQFKFIFDNMLEGVQIHDSKWHYTYANETVAKYSKCSKEELIGTTLMARYPGIEESEFFKTLEKCMMERTSKRMETELTFPNGSKSYFEVIIQPLPGGLSILSIDKTEQQKALLNLQKINKDLCDLQFALNESTILIVTDQNGIITQVNERFCQISKYMATELIGQDCRIISSNSHDKEFIKNMWTTISSGKIWRGELMNRAKDGTNFWVDTTIIPFLDKQQKPYQYYSIHSDITERKNTEEKIKAGELKYKNVVETIHESLIIEDHEGKLIYANNEFSKMFGFNSKELSQLTLKDYTAEESYEEIISRHNNRIKGVPVENEFTYKGKRKDGTEIWVEARVSPLIEGGRLIGTQSLERDITERVLVEEKLKKTSRMLAFLSAVNQSIVHAKSQDELLDALCDIGTRVGLFKMAHVGLLDENNILNMAGLSGDKAGAEKILKLNGLNINDPKFQEVPAVKVLKTGQLQYHNDLQSDPAFSQWQNDFIKHGIYAGISLPVFKFGKIAGVFGLLSGNRNFFDMAEIKLLKEAAGDISFALENFENAQKHQVAEEKIIQSERRFRQTLESMMEGVQIIGFDWRYIYVNEALTKYSTYSRDKMIGRRVMEIYPDVELTTLYALLEKCMNKRQASQLESEFVFPDGTKKYFELSIRPVPEGIFILSVDITERKKSKEEIVKLNRLYAFISAINQSIVHIRDENLLLKNACNIALKTGGFKLAKIELFDEDGILKTVSISGDAKSKQALSVAKENYVHKTLQSGKFTVNNHVQHDPELADSKIMFEQVGVESAIALPIKKFGKTIGVFNLSSSQRGFFDRREIDLLVEASGDISFALENFEKARKHKYAEEKIIYNEKRFRALIEKSTDLKTLTNSKGLFIYASPSISEVFGYSQDEFVNKPSFGFFHPDDVKDLIKKRAEIINKPGESVTFEYRIRHKLGHWIWCYGTLTNMLHEPAINALVSNFRDISDLKTAQEQKEFDTKNLDALINNTNDLLWSIDSSFRLITFNRPFFEMMKLATGKTVNKGEMVFSFALSAEQEKRFRAFYSKAFKGEIFTVTDIEDGPFSYASEISFYPIRKGDEIIGTACYSRNVSERIKQEKEREYLIKQLTSNNNDLRQFAYITSHNLRGPIANLLGLTGLLDGIKIREKALLPILNGIKSAAAMFDETLKDLSNVLTLRDNPDIQLEFISFETIFSKVKNLCEMSITDCHAEITSDFSESPKINFNKSYLESIFMNLLTNAIKYKDNYRRLQINVRTYLEDENIVLRFSDNGIGFDSEMQKEKTFKLYQRFHDHKEGKGLGLFLIKSQLDALGGLIEVHSRPDSGSTFTIRFSKTNKP